jgi:hypothetical protein
MTVAKLRGARERKRLALGKCEGRKSHSELRPELVLEAKRVRRASPLNGKRRSQDQPRARQYGLSQCPWDIIFSIRGASHVGR